MPQRSPRTAGVKHRPPRWARRGRREFAAAVTVEWLLEVVPAEVWPGVGVAPAVDWTATAVRSVALVDVSSITPCPC